MSTSDKQCDGRTGIFLPHLEETMFAVNEEYADNDTVIQEGDEVVLIPPVSGG